ncbi:MAG TPA: DegT/DnrJ/EryC1/StrS family aminotransferase [Longimicrobiales bacterium]|nr:DegT/DnrJ/EryC1/StrS family aminotransferase [Longimicrobiales bacterium]
MRPSLGLRDASPVLSASASRPGHPGLGIPQSVGGARSDDVVTRYEQAFAVEVGATHAVAFAYARNALTAILHALGLVPGDGVVLSPLTCKVVPLALLGAGFRPVYADIRKGGLNLDAASARAAGAEPRAILFQHTYGLTDGAAAVAQVAQQHGLPLIEDCAQCMPEAGAGKAGTFGAASIYSNNPGKPLPSGSGGLAVLRDPSLAARVRARRDDLPVRGAAASLALRLENTIRNRLPHALYWPAYELHGRLRGRETRDTLTREIAREVLATSVRITPADAARGERWLGRIGSLRAHRAACCAAYESALSAAPGIDHVGRGAGTALYYYPVLVDNKDELLQRARRRGVQLVAWPIRTPIYPVEDESMLPRYGYQPGTCPIAEETARRLIGLPTDLATDRRAIERVVATLCEQ